MSMDVLPSRSNFSFFRETIFEIEELTTYVYSSFAMESS
jgi:hypothetical protein